MKNNILRFGSKLNNAVSRYLIVGGVVYLLELLIIFISQKYGATPVESVTLSFTIGLITSFLLQKLFTFKDKRIHRRIIAGQALAVCLLVFFNFWFTVLVVKILESFDPMASRTIALIITTVWNYYLYKTHIFNDSDEKSAS